MNELRRHKKSDKIKWVFTGIAFVLVAVMITGICLQIFGTGKQQPSNWFKKPDTEQTTPVPDDTTDKPVLDENGNELTSGVAHAMPVQMTFRMAKSLAAATPSAQAASEYDSVTLNATVKPDSVADKTVDWAVAWVNANSQWATGKIVTNYVTVTPQSDGSTTATVQCLQPFGEQIRVTVTSRMNTNATANCTVDFAARPTSFIVTNLGLFKMSFPPYLGFSSETASSIQTVEPLLASDLNIQGIYSKQETVGCSVPAKTVCTTGDVTINSFSIMGKPTSGLLNALRAQGFETDGVYTSLDINVSGHIEHGTNSNFVYISACGIKGNTDMSVAIVNKLNTAIRNNTASNYDFDIKLTANTNVGTYEYFVKLKVNRNASVFGVENVSLSNSNLVI